jgi:hypothetical protein
LSGFSRAWQKIFYWKIDELQLVSLMPGPSMRDSLADVFQRSLLKFRSVLQEKTSNI